MTEAHEAGCLPAGFTIDLVKGLVASVRDMNACWSHPRAAADFELVTGAVAAARELATAHFATVPYVAPAHAVFDHVPREEWGPFQVRFSNMLPVFVLLVWSVS